MFSTGRRRFAWLLASTLWVGCGGSAPKVESPRAAEVDPDEFEITDEPDREIADADDQAAEDEKLAAEKVAEAEPEPEEEEPPPPKAKAKPKKVAAAATKPKKKAKKVVEPEPEPEEDEVPVDDDEPPRERVNRSSMRARKERDAGIGSGRNDREARMARDERARKGRRPSARERAEETAEEREVRAEEARAAKEAKAEKARAAKEAKAEKARKAKEAKAEKARKAKEARDAKLAAAQEARKARDAKAAAAKSRDDEEDDEDEEVVAKAEPEESEDEEEEEKPAKKVVRKGGKKAAVDEDLIEMEGDEEDEDEEGSSSIASIEEDDPLAEPRVERAEPEPSAEPVAMTSINDRTLTVAQKQLEVHGRLGLQTLTLPGATAGTTVSSTSETLALGVAYGLGAKAEVGADYTLSLNPGSIKGPLSFHVAYAAKRSAKLDVAIAAGLAFDFVDTPNMVTMMTTSTNYASLQLGAWARYRATPKVSIFTGLPALPSASPSLSKNALALPPFAYQVQLGLNNKGTTAIEVPVGLGLQIKPNIYAFASFDLAHIRLANTTSAFIFSDFIPFSLGAFYTHKKLDIGVQLSDDLKKGADYLQLGTVLRYLVK